MQDSNPETLTQKLERCGGRACAIRACACVLIDRMFGPEPDDKCDAADAAPSLIATVVDIEHELGRALSMLERLQDEL